MSAYEVVEARAEWVLPFTIADQVRIDAMDDGMRALVERYVRAGGGGVGSSMTDSEMADEIAEAVASSIDISWEVESAVRNALRKHRGGQ